MAEPSVQRIKTLWVRREYLDQILNGRKTIEVRVGYANIRRLQPGDVLMFSAEYRYRIRRVARYDTFDQLADCESISAIAPGLDRQSFLLAARSIYPPQKEALGVYALEICPAVETNPKQLLG